HHHLRLLAGEHSGGPARQQVPGGSVRSRRGRAHVRRPRAAGPDAAGQRGRRLDPRTLQRPGPRRREMNEQARATTTDVNLPKLEKSLRSTRTLFSAGMSILTAGLTLIAIVPLFSVIIMLVWKGGQRLSIALFTELPPAARMVGGGVGNALLGSLL